MRMPNFLRRVLRALAGEQPTAAVHRVEIRVVVNETPGQVAQQIAKYLSNGGRFRTSSPYSSGSKPD